MPVLFPASWIHGSPDCATNTDPPLQLHRLDPDTWILRQNKCVNPEGPFLYLLLGEQRALLVDTGATSDPRRFPLGVQVRDLLQERAPGGTPLPLCICHTHGHLDHLAGDAQVIAATGARSAAPGLPAIAQLFQTPVGPDGILHVDLGHRKLQFFALPGHTPDHIALYDENTRVLLTGDTLYPGLLTVRNWASFRRSAASLAEYVTHEPVEFVLGNHIEMKNRPRELYEPATDFQPEEHALQLFPQHVRELAELVQELGANPPRGQRFFRDEFAVVRL